MADRDAPISAAGTAPAPRDVPARPGRTLGTPLASVVAVLTTLVGLIVLAWATLFVTKGRFLKHPFERIVAGQTNRQVKVAGDFQLYFAPFNVKFLAEGLTISNPAWAGTGDFFSAKKIDTRIATWSLITGKRRINWLELADARLDLQWNRQGQNTWTFSDKPKGEPLELPVVVEPVIAQQGFDLPISIRHRCPLRRVRRQPSPAYEAKLKKRFRRGLNLDQPKRRA